MLRNLLSVLGSFVTGWILFTSAGLFSYLVSPKPAGMDFNDTTMIKEYMNGLPAYSWAIIIAGYVVGSFAAGFVIGKFAESTTKIFPLLTGIVFTVGWFVNIASFPHPTWMVVTVFILYIPIVLIGHSFASRSRVKAGLLNRSGNSI